MKNGLRIRKKGRWCGISERMADWLLNMVENLLTVTRISEGRASVNKSLEPVEEVMSEAVFRLKKRIPDANIRVLLPEKFIMIPMDAMLIEQVLINLMENAVFHAGSSEPVECSVQIEKRDVTFLVTDQGVGIPEDKLTAIFDGPDRRKTAWRTDIRVWESACLSAKPSSRRMGEPSAQEITDMARSFILRCRAAPKAYNSKPRLSTPQRPSSSAIR